MTAAIRKAGCAQSSVPLWQWALAAGGSLAIWVVFCGPYRFFHEGQSYFPLFDDGMISLEYAQNFAATGKFTVGGGTQLTAGFTSYIWVLLLAALQFLSHSTQAVVMLNFAIVLVTLALYSSVLNELKTPTRFEALNWAVVLTAPPVVFWSCRGMEVPLAMLFQALVLVTAVRLLFIHAARLTLFALCGLVAATPFVRPDLAAFSAAVAVGVALFGRPKLALLLVFALCAGIAAYMATNLILFDQVLANSYYLKVLHVPLSVRVARVFEVLPALLWRATPFVLLLLVAVGSCYWGRKSASPRRLVAFLLVAAGGNVAGWIYAGGDAWEEFPIINRFLTPLVPIALFAATILCGAADRQSREATTQRPLRLAMICMAVLTLLNFMHVVNLFGFGAREDYKYSVLGLLLGRAMPSGTAVMHYWYGQPSYYSAQYGVFSIDGLGKIDVTVARTPPKLRFKPGHDRWNHEYSLGIRRPDVIVSLPCPVSFDSAFDCGAVYREIIERYGYKPYTSRGREVTLFIRGDRDGELSSRVLDVNDRLNKAMTGYTEHRRLRGVRAFLFK